MNDFLDRLITYVLPRIRDFRGLPLSGFDGQGNYSLGLREQTVFPELPFTTQDKNHGIEITIVTSGTSTRHAQLLLTELGFPFEKPAPAEA